jgi:peptidyl-prolyl cis-trans isomerase SurA
MNKLASFLAVALLVLGATGPHAQILPVEPLDGIVAIADEDVVLRSELDRAVNNILAQYAQNPERLPPRDVLERQVLQRLIMQKLQLTRASDSGIQVSDAEVDRAIAGIAQDNGIDVSQLRMALQRQGADYEQFRKGVHDELTIQQFRQRVLQGRVHVTDAEIDNLLKNGSLNTGQLHLAQILVSIPDGATPEQIDAAHAKADDVRNQIVEGLDFAAAAIRYSDAQNALEGGDLGWRSYDELPPAFAQAAEMLEEGGISPVMRGPNGFHLVKLVGKRDDATHMVTEYHARHIMIKTSELVSDEEAHEQIVTIRSRIEAGEDFAALAKEYSDDPTSANLGGDMGWFPELGYGTRVGETVVALQDNEVSEPFRSDSGWHILQRLGTRTEDKTEESAREQARQTIANRKADEEYESFLRQMRGESYVEIRLPGSPSTP